MSENTRRAKGLLRRVLRDRRRSLARDHGLSILDIEKWPQKWQDKVMSAGVVALYMPIDEELCLDTLLEKLSSRSIRTCFPRVEGEEIAFYEAGEADSFETGSFSIQEPCSGSKKVEPSLIDILFIPGMAFDLEGTRLGRGKGYYDRFFGSLDPEKRPVCFGVAAKKNIFSAFPKDPWDLKVDALVTETSFTEFPYTRSKEEKS